MTDGFFDGFIEKMESIWKENYSIDGERQEVYRKGSYLIYRKQHES